MQELKLFMILVGCKPPGRHTEQHDVFFGIASAIKELVPGILQFWPEAKGKIHIDGWRAVNYVDGYKISVRMRNSVMMREPDRKKLFFINLGGYRRNEFDEFHYKILSVHDNRDGAIRQAKQTVFYQHTGFPGAKSHIDDKYGVDVDDAFEIEEILPADVKEKYILEIAETEISRADMLNLGYFKLDKL